MYSTQSKLFASVRCSRSLWNFECVGYTFKIFANFENTILLTAARCPYCVDDSRNRVNRYWLWMIWDKFRYYTKLYLPFKSDVVGCLSSAKWPVQLGRKLNNILVFIVPKFMFYIITLKNPPYAMPLWVFTAVFTDTTALVCHWRHYCRCESKIID